MRYARTAADHGEVTAYLLIRAVAVLQPVIAAMSDAHNDALAPAAAVIAVLLAQSAPLVTVALVRRRMPPTWLTGLEAALLAGELAAGSFITMPAYDQTWAYFVNQYSLIVIVGVGMSFRRLPVMLAVSAGPAVVYGVVSILQLGEQPWGAALDGIPYLLHSGVAWLIVTVLRHSSDRVDVAHRRLTEREVELAEEQERARHARTLHDRALQTLEILAQGDFVADPVLRGHVRAEAAWLRSFVRGESEGPTANLVVALETVAQDMARAGLVAQLNTTQLAEALSRRGQPSAEAIQALAGAVREALVNVLKHAGPVPAFVHAELDAAVLSISVLDHGCGFDVQDSEPGFGLTASIRGRIETVGGKVCVESQPGTGTHVEMRIPASRLAGGPDAALGRQPLSS